MENVNLFEVILIVQFEVSIRNLLVKVNVLKNVH